MPSIDLRWIVLVLGIVTLSACERTPQARERIFRFSMDQAPDQFDPLRAHSVYTNAVVNVVYETLFRYRLLERPYRLIPHAAERMPLVSEDGLRYRIDLREGLRFADHRCFQGGVGRAVSAEDVVYSFKRHFHPDNVSEGAWMWQEMLAGISDWVQAGADYDAPWLAVRALSERSLEFQLRTPAPHFSHTLANSFAAIVPREVVECEGADFAMRPLGSGPFQLQSFDGAVARLRANAHYQGRVIDLAEEGYNASEHARLGLRALEGKRPPLLDGIEIHYLRDASVRRSAFEAGELDYLELSKFDAKWISSIKPLALSDHAESCCHGQLASPSETIYIAFNMLDPELGDVGDDAQRERNRTLRCTLAEAYDWQARNDVLYGGLALSFDGYVPPSAPEFDQASEQSLSAPVNSIAALKQRLEAAGWTPEKLPNLRFASTGGADLQQVFELFRSRMLELGFAPEQLKWESFPSFGAFLEGVNSGKLMLMDLGWNLDYPDAINVFQLYYGPNAPPQVNSSTYRNSEFDRLYERARTLPPASERTRIYRQMEQILKQDCPAISGQARQYLQLWPKRFIAYPGRDMAGAHALMFIMPAP
jgi:ABC-type oligopeptide transport system substrate-binding subunit